MQPIGLLMKEHRLIEQMIQIIIRYIQKSKESKTIDTIFITVVIDFFGTYADKIHHGKAENILFKTLESIQISNQHKKMMEQLIEDHEKARKIMGELEVANNRNNKGDKTVLGEIQDNLYQLTILYPKHIAIEDKEFFYPIMDYFTEKECDDMIQKFFNFDRKFIHEYYHQIIEKTRKNIENLKK